MNTNQPYLKFSTDNSKLEKSGLIIHTFSLPSGYTCPGADKCLARADTKSRRIVDGKHQEFRCFSASTEAAFPAVFSARWHNLNTLLHHTEGTAASMHALLHEQLPEQAKYVRVHVGGDFFSQVYFDAWMLVAGSRPRVKFYAYTKSLTYWIKRLGEVPPNFVLTASRGGKHDALIEKHGLKETTVVYSPEEAAALGVAIDHDDTSAMTDSIRATALLVHGTMAVGSPGAAAIQELKKRGIKYSYGRKAAGK